VATPAIAATSSVAGSVEGASAVAPNVAAAADSPPVAAGGDASSGAPARASAGVGVTP
jgi:hypothetical protein